MGRSKGTKRSGKKNQNKIADNIKAEISILVTLAFCMLFLISNFGLCGKLGNMVSSVLFGVFGFIAWVIPIILFFGISFFISNQGITNAYFKVGAGILLTWILCGFMQLITSGYVGYDSFLTYYKMSSTTKNGGGIIGGFLLKMMVDVIGIVGTVFVLIILALICVIIITQRPVLKELKDGGKRVYDSAKSDAIKRRKEMAIRRQEKRKERELLSKENIQGSKEEETRRSRVVSGVMLETTLQEEDSSLIELMAEGKNTRKESKKKSMKSSDEYSFKEDKKDEYVPVIVGAAIDAKEEKTGKGKPKKDPKAVEKETQNIEAALKGQENVFESKYQIPPTNLLVSGKKGGGDSREYLMETAKKLEDTLHNFGVNVTVTNVSCGPSVTRYEIQPEQGVKVSKIVGLSDDIKLNLAAADIRIEAPIPGKAAVGIEVPNKENTPVMLRDLLESKEFSSASSKIAFAAGRDIGGKVVVADIQKMPHVLIAGATGSGKSVCINTLIMSILYRAKPEEVKLIMIDPKVVELSVYNGIPHLLIPVVTDPKKAAGALNWAVAEMTRRYQAFAECNVRDLKGYNSKVAAIKDIEDENKAKPMPQIIIIVDELADLMMVAPGEVEGAICRLAQLARAAGIHLVLATQRPSVNVITGLIKANMPSRIAFSVTSGVDSRTIIDMNGAEKLLGKGDMLFYPAGYQKPARVQGSFVSDKEVQKVVQYILDNNGENGYSDEIEQEMTQAASGVGAGIGQNVSEERDAYFIEAGRFLIEKEKASIGMLQRMFKIGFNRAARIMDQLADAGVVGEEEGTKPRKILMSQEQFEQYIEEYF